MNTAYPDKKEAKIVLFAFIWIALGMFIFYEMVSGVFIDGVVNAAYKKAHSEYNISVTAEVTDCISKSETVNNHNQMRRGVSYYYVYDYEYRGTAFSVKDNEGTARQFYKAGDITEILINPNSPDKLFDPNINRLPKAGTLIRLSAAFLHLAASVIIIKMAFKKKKITTI